MARRHHTLSPKKHETSARCRASKNVKQSSRRRCVRGAPDRRSLHFSTIANSHWLNSSASRYTLPPPKPYNPLSVVIRRPPPYYPMPPPPSSPFPPSSRPGHSGPFKWHSLSTTPSVSIPCPPPTLVPSFTVSPCATSVCHPSSRPV